MAAPASSRPAVSRRSLLGLASPPRPKVDIRVDPLLLGEAVRERILQAHADLLREYRRESDAIYGLSILEREAGFAELDARTFDRLGLRARIEASLAGFEALFAERPLYIVRAESYAQEGADLAHIDGGSAVRLAMRVERLEPAVRLERLVAHELLHVEDMLDPSFGYDRHRAIPGATNAERELARERFRFLWGVSVDARLPARGLEPLRRYEEWRSQGESAFPRAELRLINELIESVHRGPRPTHAEMISKATRPDLGAPRLETERNGQPCPLCRFACFDWADLDVLLRAEAAITRDFPEWKPADGACTQCSSAYPQT